MSSLIKTADLLYGWFLKAAKSLQSPLLLAIRLYWGWQFWQSGLDHFHNMADFVTFMSERGIPAPWLNAHFVASLEAGGGILLALGLGSRLIAVPLVVNMAVAYITADRDKLLAIFSDHAEDFYRATPFSFLFVALLILVFGPGKISVDTLIARYRKKKQAPPAPA